MTLRPRLALTLVLTAVPLILVFAWARRELLQRYEVQMIRDLVLTRAASLGRERCESDPEELLPLPGRRLGPPGLGRAPGFGPAPEPPPRVPGAPRPPDGPAGLPPGPPPPALVRAFVYDGAFQPVDPAGPPFPPELRQALESGSDHASRRLPAAVGRGDRLEVAVRTGWTGSRCAVVLARRVGPPPASSMGLLWGALPLLGLLLASVLVAAGPMVRRIRGLTSDVRRSADTLYESKVQADGDDEITELARAFNEAGAKVRVQVAALEERDRTLRAFLADTTHDVMIPLTVLVGHLSNLRKRLAGKGAVGEADLLPALQEAQYLASLIHNLGAAAKLEAGEPLVERHPVDLGALVERVVERHRPVAEPAGVAVEFGAPEGPVVVEGDVTLIEQAVSNVVHNAVRYNRRGGHVAVLLEETTAPAGFRLRVVDDGPGVPDSELQRLGERRRRGDEARQRQPGGLGLGLHIAFGVAERHGFRMGLGRSEYGGLEVTITGALAPAARG